MNSRSHGKAFEARWSVRQLAIGLALAVVCASACSATHMGPPGNSNTNWLSECNTSSDCRDGSGCLCGICTRACDTDAECGGAIAGTQCLAMSEPRIAARCLRTPTAVARVCAASCDSDATCRELRADLTCEEGACVVASKAAAPDAGVAPATNACSGCDGGAAVTDAGPIFGAEPVRPRTLPPGSEPMCAEPRFSTFLARDFSWLLSGALEPGEHWVVVERSTQEQLVLYAGPGASPDGSASPGSVGHCFIKSDLPLPIIPLGARLWLHTLERVVDDAERAPGSDRALGYELSLRDRKGGTLLLHDTHWPSYHDATNTLVFSAPEALCTVPDYASFCPGNATQYSLLVEADVPKRVKSGDHATIALGGREYDLYLRSSTRVELDSTQPCSPGEVEVDDRLWTSSTLRLLDPTALALGRGSLPECTLGNAPADGFEFYVFERESGQPDPHEGDVIYVDGRNITDQYFSAVVDFGSGPSLVALRPTPLLQASDQQRFWMRVVRKPNQVFTLRAVGRGELLLAGANIPTASDAPIDFAFDVPVRVRRDCDYEAAGALDPELALYRVVWGEGPDAIEIRTGDNVRVMLEGRPYDVHLSLSRTTQKLPIESEPNSRHTAFNLLVSPAR